MKINSERRKFFKKASAGVIGAGVLSALPLNLFSKTKKETKNPESNVNIAINPMAIKREKRK